MLNKNIKNINKMLVKNKDNMFGGSTKRPPPPPPSLPSSSSLSSSSFSPPRTVRNIQLSEFSPPKLSPLITTTTTTITTPTPITTTTTAAESLPYATAAAAVPILSSKSSISVSSFPPQSASSASLPTTRLPTVAAAATILSGRTKLIQQQQRHRHRQIQQQQQHQQYHHHHHHHHHTPQLRFRLLPGLKATSFFTILTLVCLETVLLSTVSNCAKTFYMHWNTSNSIFRIDNTDHIIDVNKGNLAFEFDQVHIICPVYEPGTFENETEKYIIYNVSKVEYETCRITNADPRVIAICDKPQKLMFFTITFRPFTPQPGGLEFLPGNDYYFISTSSKDDLYRRIGGRCSTNNMKVVFKVCCAPEDKNNRTNNNIGGGSGSGGGIGNGGGNSGSSNSNTAIQQQHNNNININGGGGGGGQLPSPKLPGMGGGINNGGGLMINGNSGTSINTNIDQFNRIPMQQPNNIGGGSGGMGMGGMSGNGGVGGQHQTGIRINNVPSSQQHPSQKNGMHGGFISPMANINTNSSNVVQSTISWPEWGNHNNHNGDHGGGSGEGGINVQQHSTPVSTIGIHPHFYPSHITSPRPNINSAVNNNSNYSPSHKPTKKTNDYDKHPNEVVKNEELTYNSAASSLSFYKMTRRRTATTVSLRKTLRYSKSAYKSIYQKFKSLLQLLLFTSNHRNRINTINTLINFISNCNPIIITTTVLVTLTNLFQYKLSSWSLRRCISQKAASLSSSSSASAAAATSTLSSASSSEDDPVFSARKTSSSFASLLSSSYVLRPLPISPPPPPLSPVDCIITSPVSNTLNIASSSTR